MGTRFLFALAGSEGDTSILFSPLIGTAESVVISSPPPSAARSPAIPGGGGGGGGGWRLWWELSETDMLLPASFVSGVAGEEELGGGLMIPFILLRNFFIANRHDLLVCSRSVGR